jgi:hypothetical protein
MNIRLGVQPGGLISDLVELSDGTWGNYFVLSWDHVIARFVLVGSFMHCALFW